MKIGVGWIGWTEDETLDSSMYAIHMAHQGRVEMLQAIFGKGDDSGPTPKLFHKPKASDVLTVMRSLAGKPAKGAKRNG